ncbi:protein SULFUR DEFICIENCY-INDUCED 1-like [Dioscorea cayenensis subsp. rotundata]|uniref:Protein SULFUR DEFICIENCY-INDUCED 1-like n=1 Tax=Dioscorea cayennensis subsp. rotundata TaxID=55577 RepID=A0AB40D6L0_DIOCR|nr:protein SULFUR DEFICIENCY-INDUCED 1-like [Dioscorea cayenensis subsp. rotundata]
MEGFVRGEGKGKEIEAIEEDNCTNKGTTIFHVIHKIPAGDTPYVRAKHLQIVEKDPERSIVWFWKAINAGDRVDSALKDMAVVMKQQDRAAEAVEAIKSFRHLCSNQSQESIDNILIDLYKACGKMEEHIELLKQKLEKVYLGEAFNGKTTKKARSHGKKFQVTVTQETSRLLGNLGWAYMQQNNYTAAEAAYLKAQMLDPDANKACNLGICLMKQGRLDEARKVLQDILNEKLPGSNDSKTVKRTEELLDEIESQALFSLISRVPSMEDEIIERLEHMMQDWSQF